MIENYVPAAVDGEALKVIQDLEASLGKVVVAVSPKPEFAALTPEQLNALKAAEEKLGVTMVAYEN